MKKTIIFFVLFIALLFIAQPLFAQSSPLSEQPPAQQEYFVKGKVIQIIKESYQQVDGYNTLTQVVKVQILEGPQTNKIVTIQRGSDVRLTSSQKIDAGTTVILDVLNGTGTGAQYSISDTYRLNYLLYIGIAFFFVTLLFTGKKGLGAIIGLLISLLTIMLYIVPQILHHQNPLIASLVGSLIILIVTTYLAHGISKQTSIAVLSTFFSLIGAVIFAIICVNIARLAGLGTEDSYLLELNPTQAIDPKGLLLGGILIGTLGALNDITTTQVAAIFTLFKHNKKLNFLQLAEQGFLIGREHILSLVNTLVLAYAGTSLTIFIFFALNPSHLPWWVIINNESVAEEIVRTIAGSAGLILAVPITSFLAAWIATREGLKES